MTIQNVPENVAEWLIAQGYTVIGSSEDKSTTPPTKLFDLIRSF